MVSSKGFVIALVVVAAVLFFIGYAAYPLMHHSEASVSEKSWQEIQKKGYITVATSPDWPPFQFIDPKTNKIVGYEVDLMNAVAQKLGLKVEWKPMGFDSIIAAVKNGEVDLGVSGFSITPDRCDEVLFTIYHDVTEVQLIMTAAKAKELGITKLNSLSDIAKYKLTVGTGSGTTEEKELLDLVKKGVISASQVKSYPDFGAALKDLEAGNIDAVYAETPVTTWWMSTEKTPLVVVYGKPYWPVAFIANKNSLTLVSKIDGVLAEMIANGELDAIKAKWNITTPP
jgi:ABC-type amino acid transport substrate-binding protein